MLVTNHVLSGAFVGRAAPSLAGAFGWGVASHLALDAVPHWGDARPIEEIMHIAVPDGLLGLAAMAAMTARSEPGSRLRVLAGMAGAAFPDLDKPARRYLGRSPFPASVDRLHAAVQHESPGRLPQEVLVGVAQFAVLLLLTSKRHRKRRAGGSATR